VVALAVGQAEQPLFENLILAVPKGQTETESLLIIGNTRDAVLTPAVGAGAAPVHLAFTLTFRER
jgi:hypothetical protein